MYNELEKLGYPPLIYETSGFLLRSIINTKKPVNIESKPANEENEFENKIYSLIKTQKVKTQKNILHIYHKFYNIEFDYKDIMETLRFSASASGELLRKLKYLELIIKTNKSKYKFNNSFNSKNIL